MSDHASFVASVPGFYDRGLGPVIFAAYAADLAARVAASSPLRVLETAAGTGILTRELRDRLPADASLTATDVNPPMLDVAREQVRAGEVVAFQPADACALPFADGVFDALACQFGVMFFPDKAQAYREAHRVLAPGGRFVFNVWDAMAHNPFARIAHGLMLATFSDDPPQFFSVPFGYHAVRPITTALAAAGFVEITSTVLRQDTMVADIAGFAQALVFGNPLAEQIRARGGASELVAAVLEAALRAELGPQPARMPLQAIVFEATRG